MVPQNAPAESGSAMPGPPVLAPSASIRLNPGTREDSSRRRTARLDRPADRHDQHRAAQRLPVRPGDLVKPASKPRRDRTCGPNGTRTRVLVAFSPRIIVTFKVFSLDEGDRTQTHRSTAPLGRDAPCKFPGGRVARRSAQGVTNSPVFLDPTAIFIPPNRRRVHILNADPAFPACDDAVSLQY